LKWIFENKFVLYSSYGLHDTVNYCDQTGMNY